MKILQVGLGNNPGGVEAFVMNYYRELSGQAVFFYRNTVKQEETQNDTGKTDG